MTRISKIQKILITLVGRGSAGKEPLGKTGSCPVGHVLDYTGARREDFEKRVDLRLWRLRP